MHLHLEHPRPTRYSSILTKHFPTGDRTCIDTHALLYVDCARKHDRERIAVIEAREAVATGDFPGPQAIRKGPSGRYLVVAGRSLPQARPACTAYLRAVSTTKKLTGVAEIDVDEWPAPGGSYPVDCEADTRAGPRSPWSPRARSTTASYACASARARAADFARSFGTEMRPCGSGPRPG